MTSAGKWVLGLLLLVVGAVFVARTISSEPGSQAQVKLPAAESAGASKESAAAKAAAAKKAAAAPATDLVCKKACVEVHEVANDSVTTAKLAPGSVTLSKLAFEVPNLNELVNEINARRAAEASAKAALAEAAAATAQNDAAISAAAANGLSVEAAARAAAIEKLAKEGAAADAGLLTKMNEEIANRGAADDVLQGKLNSEIAERAGAIANLRSELGNPNQVDAPIVQINNNEIVAGAVTTDKILDRTILAKDLAVGAVTTVEILNRTILAEDLSSAAVVGRAAGETLTNTKERSLRGERTNNSAASTLSAGDLALGTLTGEGDNITTRSAAVGNIGLRTIGRNNLVDGAVDTDQLEADSVTSAKIAPNTITFEDVSISDATNLTSANIRTGSLFGTLTPSGSTAAATSGDLALGTVSGQGDNDDAVGDTGAITGNLGLQTVGRGNLADLAVSTAKLEDSAVTSQKIALNTITADDVSNIEATNLTSANIRKGTVTGQGDNDDSTDAMADNTTVTGNLGLSTVGRRNLVDGAVDATKLADQSVNANKLTSGFLLDLVTEAEFTARLTTPVPTATMLNGDRKPNNAATGTDPGSTVDWSRLNNVPGGFADNVDDDGATGLNAYKNELDGDPSDTTINETTGANKDDVSWFKLRDVPEEIADGDDNVDGGDAGDLTCTKAAGCVSNAEISGTIDADKLSGGIDGTKIADGTIMAVDLAGTYSNEDADPELEESVIGAVTSAKIADGTIEARDLGVGSVTVAKLGTDVIARFVAVENRALALETRLTNLGSAPAASDTDRVHTTRLTGQNIVTVALDPGSVPATGRLAQVIPVTGLAVGDLVTVAPPATLNDDLLFVGHDVEVDPSDISKARVIVYLYNPTAAAIDDPSSTWKVQYLDLTP